MHEMLTFSRNMFHVKDWSRMDELGIISLDTVRVVLNPDLWALPINEVEVGEMGIILVGKMGVSEIPIVL